MIKEVEIDGSGGFCGGVIRAITSAEDFLASHPGETLYSLGPVVLPEDQAVRRPVKAGRRRFGDRDRPLGSGG